MKKFFGFLHLGTHAHLASATRRRRNTLRTILPLFLIFTILAGTFAPFSATLQVRKTFAEGQTGEITSAEVNGTSIVVKGSYNYGPSIPSGKVQVVLNNEGNISNLEDTAVTIYDGVSPGVSKNFEITISNIAAGKYGGITLRIIGSGPTNTPYLIDTYTFPNPPLTIGGGSSGTNTGTGSYVNDLNDQVQKTTTNLQEQIGCTEIGNSSITACLQQVLYFFMYSIPAWLLTLSGSLFDALAGLTLSTKLYTGSSFIGYAWGIVRDLSNIFFIFILLFIAISLILGLEIGHANPKKMLISVVIIAILLNFSMFFTKIIIDSSNILARLFYNQITVTAKDTSGNIAVYAPIISKVHTDVDEKGLSGIIVSAFRPQILTNPDFYNKFKEAQVGSYYEDAYNSFNSSVGVGIFTGAYHLAQGALTTPYGTGVYATVNLPVSVTISLIVTSGLIFLFATFAFVKSSLAFVGRIIGLWIQIIFAPFAFITYIIPSMQHIEGIGWTGWWKKTIELAFMAPIFMFFIYLISLLAKSSVILNTFNPDLQTTGGLVETLLLIIIPMLIIMLLLLKATEYAVKASGEIGAMVIKGATGAAQFVSGAAIGLGAGATAFAGRNIIGRAASAVNQEKLDKWRQEATGTGTSAMIARQKLKTIEGLKTSSFDARQNVVASKLSTAVGVNLNQLGNVPGLKNLSTAGSAGGFTGAQERGTKKMIAEGERLGINMTKKKDIEAKTKTAKAALETAQVNQKQHKEQMEDELKAPNRELELANNAIRDHKDQNGKDAKVPQPLLDRRTLAENEVKKVKDDHEDIVKDDGRTIENKKLDIEKLDKALKNNEKAIVKEYVWERMKKNSPYELHKNEERDAFGNIKEFGHFDTSTKVGSDELGKRFVREFAKSFAKGAAKGLVVGSVLPGVGTIPGAVVGGMIESINKTTAIGLNKYFADYYNRAEDAEHELQHTEEKGGKGTHGHESKHKDKYSGPAVNIFKGIFNIAPSSSKKSGKDSPAAAHH